MSKPPRTETPMRPMDYAVLYGMPLLFLLLAVLLVSAYLGQTPQSSVVKKLRQGVVKAGMSEVQVVEAVGEPKGTVERPDGTYTFRYQGSAWDPERKVPIEEDAYIDFDSSGYVKGITFDSRVPEPVPAEPAKESSGSKPAEATGG